jgi:hypothetical protein
MDTVQLPLFNVGTSLNNEASVEVAQRLVRWMQHIQICAATAAGSQK